MDLSQVISHEYLSRKFWCWTFYFALKLVSLLWFTLIQLLRTRSTHWFCKLTDLAKNLNILIKRKCTLRLTKTISASFQIEAKQYRTSALRDRNYCYRLPLQTFCQIVFAYIKKVGTWPMLKQILSLLAALVERLWRGNWTTRLEKIQFVSRCLTRDHFLLRWPSLHFATIYMQLDG